MTWSRIANRKESVHGKTKMNFLIIYGQRWSRSVVRACAHGCSGPSLSVNAIGIKTEASKLLILINKTLPRQIKIAIYIGFIGGICGWRSFSFIMTHYSLWCLDQTSLYIICLIFVFSLQIYRTHTQYRRYIARTRVYLGKRLYLFCQILLLHRCLINLSQTVFRLPSLFGLLSREDMDVLRFNIVSLSTIWSIHDHPSIQFYFIFITFLFSSFNINLIHCYAIFWCSFYQHDRLVATSTRDNPGYNCIYRIQLTLWLMGNCVCFCRLLTFLSWK